MPPASLTGAVHESKAQRQERLKSRFRDRGGWVFALHNASPGLANQHDLASSYHQMGMRSPTYYFPAASMASPPKRSALHIKSQPTRPKRERHPRLEGLDPRPHALAPPSEPHASRLLPQAMQMKITLPPRRNGVTHLNAQSCQRAGRLLVRHYVRSQWSAILTLYHVCSPRPYKRTVWFFPT
jgi:hypothetical protein